MTERDAFLHLLEKADGDPHKALRLAVRWIASNGLLISAGFVRSSPYDHINRSKKGQGALDAKASSS